MIEKLRAILELLKTADKSLDDGHGIICNDISRAILNVESLIEDCDNESRLAAAKQISEKASGAGRQRDIDGKVLPLEPRL